MLKSPKTLRCFGCDCDCDCGCDFGLLKSMLAAAAAAAVTAADDVDDSVYDDVELTVYDLHTTEDFYYTDSVFLLR